MDRGDLGVKDVQSGFRAYTSEALNAVIFAHADGYGVEMEQLYIAKKKGLRVVEVPIEVSYKVNNPSKKHPLLHGIDLIMTLIRMAVEERLNGALLPGIFVLAAGPFSGLMLILNGITEYFVLFLAMLMPMGLSLWGILGDFDFLCDR